MFSENENFINIYHNEVNNYMKTRSFLIDTLKYEYNISNEKEYFASIVACYMIYPEDLLEYCPLTYNYIESIVNEIDLNYKNQNK